jgi:urea transport system ATP-binding protein
MSRDVDFLELSDVRIVFDGFAAVDGVSMTVLHGDLRFLIGPNGAGKTTLVDGITGLVQPPVRSSSARQN